MKHFMISHFRSPMSQQSVENDSTPTRECSTTSFSLDSANPRGDSKDAEKDVEKDQTPFGDDNVLSNDDASVQSEDLMQDENRNRWTFPTREPSIPSTTSRQRPRCYESDQSYQSLPSLASTIESLEESAQDNFSDTKSKTMPWKVLSNKVIVSEFTISKSCFLL